MSDIGQIVYTTHRLKNGNWLYLNWQDLLAGDFVIDEAAALLEELKKNSAIRQ